MQYELEIPVRESLVDVTKRFPVAVVPHHDSTAAILTFWDGTLESPIFNGVILYLHRQSFVTGEVTWSFCNCPTFEYTTPS